MGLALFSQAITSALIALALGFIACDIAAKQQNGVLKNGGLIAGGIAMVLGVVMVFNGLYMSVTVNSRMKEQQQLQKRVNVPAQGQIENQTQMPQAVPQAR